jgi:hypothetical protein
MQGMLGEQKSLLEHIFKSRPNLEEEINVPIFESTTFDIWLVPRLVTAAAVLSTRCATVLPGASERNKALRSSLISFASDILRRSLQESKQRSNVRLVLLECLKASLRSLTCIGRPSFLPSAPPPIQLLPREGDRPRLASFFSSSQAEASGYTLPQKPYGDGINRIVSIIGAAADLLTSPNPFSVFCSFSG